MRTDSSESFLSCTCPHVIVNVCELVKKLNSNIEESLCRIMNTDITVLCCLTILRIQYSLFNSL